jgi:hypothetical protein
MGEEVIQTEVDKLIDLLKTKKKIEIKYAAQELKVPEDVIQQWVDFLVEEKVLAIEYEFTKPFISLIRDNANKNDSEDDLQAYKKKFKNQNKTNKQNSEIMWKTHIIENLEFMKPFFYSEADKRNFENTDELWKEYKNKVTHT